MVSLFDLEIILSKGIKKLIVKKFNMILLDKSNKIFVLLIGLSILTTVMLLSIRTGFISPDSWNYLRLASFYNEEKLCTINGSYFAVFPCGYPIMIAGISWISSLDLFTSSKVLNLIALSLSGVFLYLATRNIILGFLFVINPVALGIAHYTWSENTFLLAFSMVFYSLTKIYKAESNAKVILILVLGLFVGVSSRYFFAPYAFVIFISTLLIYGVVPARKSLLYFCIAGVAFITYYLFNKEITGYGTGMPRIPAPESELLLLLSFSKYIIIDSIKYILALAPIVSLLVWGELTKQIRDEIKTNELKPYYLLAALGFSYLTLALLMRMSSQYDLYGYRTVGYGLVFIFTALISCFFQNIKLTKKHLLMLFVSGVFSLVLSQERFYLGFGLSSLENKSTYKVSIDNYKKESSPILSGTIVYLEVPQPSYFISSNTDLFYGKEYEMITPKIAPYWERETANSLVDRINISSGNCTFDFTRINSNDKLNEIINSKFPVNVSFENGLMKPILIYEDRYDETMKEFIRSAFVPGKAIACRLK